MSWDVLYTDDAIRDLQEIRGYISDVLRAPETAERQVIRIMDAAESLDHMPLRHRLCDYEPLRSQGFRILPVDNYLVLYLPDESQGSVAISRVIYGSRDIERHLGE